MAAHRSLGVTSAKNSEASHIRWSHPTRVPTSKDFSYWTRAPLDCQRQNNQPTPCRLLLNVWGPIQNVWGLIHFVCSSQYVHGARSTVLYCTVLRAFSHFHAIYRSFPYNSARNSYFPLHLCAGPVGDSGAQINQPTGARVQTSTSLGSPVSTCSTVGS